MNPMQVGALNEISLKNRFYAWQQLDVGAKSAQARADEVFAELQRAASAVGLGRTLDRLRHPPSTPIPVEAPTVRVRVRKAFRVFVPNRYAELEEYSAAADAVVDVPESCLRQLGDRVEPAPAGTKLNQIPAPLGTPTMGE
jgi:hypothetical protein